MPGEPEAHGLIALLELQASRAHARVGPRGEPVLLLEQNRARWDHLLIRRGLAALERAQALCDSHGGRLGPYALQAAIAACHARAREPGETDWVRIAALYTGLAQVAGSPVVELNRAVAMAWPSARRSHCPCWRRSRPSRRCASTTCLLYTSPSPRDRTRSRMPSSA